MQTRSEERYIFVGLRPGWSKPQPLRVRVERDGDPQIIPGDFTKAENWLSRETAKSNESYFRKHAPDLQLLALVKITIREEVGVEVLEVDDLVAGIGNLIEAWRDEGRTGNDQSSLPRAE